jgi:hypothetical protein
MLQSPVRSLREKRLSQAFDDDYNCDPMADFDDEFDDDGGGVDAKGRAKSRRELPSKFQKQKLRLSEHAIASGVKFSRSSRSTLKPAQFQR